MAIRAFLAVDLPSNVRKSIDIFQQELRPLLPNMKWVNPQSIHLTVKFLGDIQEEHISLLKSAVQKSLAECFSFPLCCEGLGGFPSLNRPRILWAGVSGDVELFHNLVARVEEAVTSLGFPQESKPFHPHFTLARMKGQFREAGMALEKSGLLGTSHGFGTIDVDKISLYQSELHPTGATYHCLWTISLRGTKTA